MTVTAAFCPLSLQVLFDANGFPVPGGQLRAFDAGTTTPRTLFADAGLTTALPTPVLTDAFGRWPAMFVGVGDYKIVVGDATGAQMFAANGLAGGTDSGTAPTPTGTTIPTGMVLGAHTDEQFDGWLPLNAKTIGPAGSGATARANADVQSLYVKLWNKDASLTVLGGRGVSATADWNAAKTLSLPDYRGRSPTGCDGMGNTLAGVLSTFVTLTPDKLGSILGADRIALTVDQLASHGHNVTVGAAGGHTPGGTTTGVSDHTHTGTTDYNGDHNHNYQNASANTTVVTVNDAHVVYASPATTTPTSTAGGHTHTFTTGAAGAHSHGLTMNAVPDHTHSASADAAGAGSAHVNVQPSILCFWHIKL